MIPPSSSVAFLWLLVAVAALVRSLPLIPTSFEEIFPLLHEKNHCLHSVFLYDSSVTVLEGIRMVVGCVVVSEGIMVVGCVVVLEGIMAVCFFRGSLFQKQTLNK